MIKNKIYSIMLISIIICVAAANLCEAETLNGEIDVEINQTLGIVSPQIDIANETSVNLSFETYEWEKDTNETVYMVNDTIKINLNIINNTDRDSFLLPRSVYYSIFITRSLSDAGLRKKHVWEDKFIKRIIPVKAFGAINVVESYLGKNKTDNITIPLKYTIRNDTTNENLILHIMVMGFLPGDVDGISKLVKIVEYKKVSLNVTYVEM